MAGRRVVSVGLATLLLAGGVVALNVGATSAGAVERPMCTDFRSAVVAAAALAQACGGRVEVLSARSQTGQTFANADGSMTLEQSVEPRWARRSDGTWAGVDPSLRMAADGTVVPVATVQAMSFSGGGTGPLATLTDGGRHLALTWPTPLPAPRLRGESATYPEVLPGVDLRVTASARGFSEVLVVKTRAAAANPALKQVRFGLSGTGLTMVAVPGGGVEARDDKGRAVFRSPAPLLWDSSAEAAGPATSSAAASAPGLGRRQAAMPVQVSADQLSITPDAKLLGDPATTYPVYIDPSWSGGIWNGTDFTSVWSKSGYGDSSFWNNSTALNDASTRGSAGVGRTCDTSDINGNCTSPQYVIRSLFRMNTAGVLGKQVFSATFRIQQQWSWTCNPATYTRLWLTTDISPSTTWNNQPYWNPNIVADGYANHRADWAYGCAGSGDVEFDATTMVRNSVAVGSLVTPVGLRAIDESTTGQWKRFNFSTAIMAITYNSGPNAPTQLTVDGKPCVSGAGRPFVATASPTLKATVSDPDGDSLAAWFATARWDPAQNVFVDVPGGGGVQYNVPSGSSAQVTPTGEVDGGIYNFRTVASDPWSSGPTVGGCEWQVDLVDPITPTVTGDVYREGSVGCPPTGCGGVGQSGRFTFGGSSADVAYYKWGIAPASPTSIATPAALGATATVTWTLTQGAATTLVVQAVDRAGRVSPVKNYQFQVAGLAPAVARWVLSEAPGSTTLFDVSGNAHNATLSGGTLGVPGRLVGGDSALSLTGDTANQARTTGPVVDTSRSFSVAAWVKLADKTSSWGLVDQGGR